MKKWHVIQYNPFVKGYEFLVFAKDMGRNIGKNISKNLSHQYSEKFLNLAKQFAKDTLKTVSKRAVQKTAEATGDLIKLHESQKTLTHDNSKENIEHDRGIYREKEKDIYLQNKDRKLLII